MRGIVIGRKYRDRVLCISIPAIFVGQALFGRRIPMNETNKSEVARIKQQIAIEYQAASRVFTDFNAKARHAYLTARQEKLGVCLEELTLYMSPDEAMQTFIQVQAEIVQKLPDGQTTKASSEKFLVGDPSADTTNSYDETGGSSSGTTS
jgi:hypothetical protein